MENEMVKICILLTLLACTASGQEKFMVCKSIENVFTDVGSEHPGALTKRIQGPPGKRGVPGSPGPPGLPGIQGIPGTPAAVDYDRISDLIEDKIRRGLEEVNSRIDILKSNITALTEALPNQSCEARSGLLYEGKCYFAPSFVFSSSLTYDDAMQKCSNAAALIAEIHSRNEQQALENFFRTKMPSSRSWIQLWTGMLYQSSARNVRFRSGKEVAIDQFKWDTGYPTGSHEQIALEIRKDAQSRYGGLFNRPPSNKRMMVLCEI